MTMRHLLVLCSAAFALAACNGGEDFSDATVPGCPIGAQCEPSSRGNVLVELVGPAVANLGYECGNSLNFTSDEETTTADGEVTIPPFNAVCPANAKSIEFFLGSRLASPSSDVTHNSVTLGRYLFPQQLQKGAYQVTMADLVEAPTRSSIVPGDVNANSVLNRAALIQALDSDGDPANEVKIPEEAHEFIDQQYNTLVPAPQAGGSDIDADTSYSSFTADWEDVITGVDAEVAIAGFENDTSNYQERLQKANNRTRAGLYAFDTAGECLILQGCGFEDDNGIRTFLAMKTLVLPDGEILSGGLALISDAAGEGDPKQDFVGFDSHATLSDTLELIDSQTASPGVALDGAEIEDIPESTDTNAEVSGKVLGQTIYAGLQFEDGPGDFKLDYPSASHELKEAEKGKLGGSTATLIGEDVSGNKAIPLRATKTGAVQVSPDESVYTSLQGEYTLRLMRACVDDDLNDDNDPANDDSEVCSAIPDPDEDTEENEEITLGNYPDSIGVAEITSERVREDAHGVQDVCLTIQGNGLVATGAGGACGTDYVVGLITRTFDDPASANITLFLAPGLDVEPDIAHYYAYIEGRIDLGADADCRPMYRLSEENFELGLRAKWEETLFLPSILNEEFGEEPSDAQNRRKEAVSNGAVQFFKNGVAGCDPLATP
ncbi:MAG: hypothetical protein MI745_10025 [Pseudomonadales bacterium]|nr:hypothetical protein [Pseudomonadales bacterium]